VVAAIVKDAIDGPSIQIVAEAADRTDLSELVTSKRADVVIVPTEKSAVARQYHELLQQNPGVKVLTIASDSSSADLYELCFLGRNIGCRGVVEAIRIIVGRERAEVTAPGGT
jgi:hypothetical protein